MKKLEKHELVQREVNRLKLEMDYELMTLSDALQDGDISAEQVAKRQLESIRGQLVRLGYFPTE